MKSTDRILKSIERKFAYIFCMMRILVDLAGAGIAIAFFIQFFQKANSTDTYILLIGFLIAMLFLMGADIHMIISRDIKHIRSTNSNKKEDITKKNKIEY